MISHFLDSPVFLHALGEPTVTTEACLELVRRARTGAVRLHTTTECVQEVLFHRVRMAGAEAATRQARAIVALCVVHPFDDAVLQHGLTLVEKTPIRGRDAFIAATAMLAGFDQIVTTDNRFVEVPGLRRVDPRDLT